MRFTPDGNFLYTASRTSNVISCWDIRDTANVLYELPRPGKTSQRITFDIDPSGKTLVSGDQVRMHNAEILMLCTHYWYSTAIFYFMISAIQKVKISLRIDFCTGWKDIEVRKNRYHDDYSALCTNQIFNVDITSCATWNPVYPWLLATCSGQRKFELDDSDSDSDDGDDNDRQEQVVDNSLSIWQVPGTPEWYSLEASS